MNNELWKAINELYQLLSFGCNTEQEFQEFFERNPIVFRTLGFDSWKPFDSRSGNQLPYDGDKEFQPQPDFICGISSPGEIVVFEIKTPLYAAMTTSRQDVKRTKFREKINSYISQTSEYVRFIRGSDTARVKIREIIGQSSYSSCRGVLVCGVNDPTESVDIARLMAQFGDPKIELLTYDTLLDKLAEAFAIARPDVLPTKTKMAGVTLVLVTWLPDKQLNSRAVLLDVGQGSARLVVYIEGGQGYVEFVDDSGKARAMECDFPVEKCFTLKLEISSGAATFFANLSIDYDETDIKLLQREVNFTLNSKYATVGADRDGNFGACARILYNCVTDKVLPIDERLVFMAFTEERKRKGGGCLEFRGAQFLYLVKDGSFIQEDSEKRPRYMLAEMPWQPVNERT